MIHDTEGTLLDQAMKKITYTPEHKLQSIHGGVTLPSIICASILPEIATI